MWTTQTTTTFDIGGYSVEMTEAQARRWNAGETTTHDLRTIRVAIPKPTNSADYITMQRALNASLSPETASAMSGMPANRIGEPRTRRTNDRSKHYRLVGALLMLPVHFMELADWCHPTITGSIRCGELEGDAKKRYGYLEVQEVTQENPDSDEYKVVDSWSHSDSY